MKRERGASVRPLRRGADRPGDLRPGRASAAAAQDPRAGHRAPAAAGVRPVATSIGRLAGEDDLRAVVLPGPYGQDLSIRVLDPARFITELDALSMSPDLLARWRDLIRRHLYLVPNSIVVSRGAFSVTTLLALR